MYFLRYFSKSDLKIKQTISINIQGEPTRLRVVGENLSLVLVMNWDHWVLLVLMVRRVFQDILILRFGNCDFCGNCDHLCFSVFLPLSPPINYETKPQKM